jgi:beta-phosphoglucomutase-like phosphatase (HAD superfamily)
VPSPRDPEVLGADVVLLDVDGNLVPSEEPAFEAATEVANALLATLGATRRYEAAELRQVALGRNFRALAQELAHEADAELTALELEEWVRREQVVVTRHLAEVLQPDLEVVDALCRLSARCTMAVVSSSALARIEASLGAAGLSDLLPRELWWSAQDSLSVPTSKPDPAVYRAALHGLGVTADRAVAVEDARAGVESAVGAGIRTVGHLVFVPQPERAEHARLLRDAGAVAVVESWHEVASLLGAPVGALCTADSNA